VTGSNDAMNRLIREAGGPSSVLTLLEPSGTTDVPPVGRSSVGFGDASLPPRRHDRDAANEAIRHAALLARQLTVPGGVDISDLFNGSATATRVNLDHIPEVGRPEPVSAVLCEAVELRARLREATERLAELQSKLDEQERSDVEAAAQAIRQGSSPPTISAGIAKSRAAIETQTRQVRALTLASDACQADPASTMIEASTAWREALDAEVERARADGRAAIGQLGDSCARVGDATST
jgi:hypothetical protein